MFELAKIISFSGNKITLELPNEINPEYLKMLSRGKENFAKLKFLDNDPRTLKQNAFSHALLADVAWWYADDPKDVEHMLRYNYEYDQDEAFSHATASKDDMNKWLAMLIQFVLKNGVELSKRYDGLLERDDFFYWCCKYRKCAVCGIQHAQIHHVIAVGNRHRNNVDHRLFPFASLCFKHHNLAHELGQTEFINKFRIIPVLLDKEALIKIGIMSNAQIMNFDKQYKTEGIFKKAIEGK